WKATLKVEQIPTNFQTRHSRILVQSVLIANEVLLIHIYIAPELRIQARADFWRDLQYFLEEWIIKFPNQKIIATCDLNTRDRRFGINHQEKHSYLDEVVAHLD